MGKFLTALSISLTFLAGFLFVLTLREETWIRQEVSIKLKDYIDVVKPLLKNSMQQQYKNQETKDGNSMAIFKKIDKYIESNLGSFNKLIHNVELYQQINFGLQKLCMYVTLKGFQNPINVFVPSVQLCINYDVFDNPTQYKLPARVSQNQKTIGLNSFKGSFVCMIIALVLVLLASIFMMSKSTPLYRKWKKVIIVLAVSCCIGAGIIVSAAHLNINGNFTLKEKYDQSKDLATRSMRYGSYGDDYGENSKIVKLLNSINLKQSLGCAGIYAAVGIILLIITILLNVLEFCSKSEEETESYNKLKLDRI